MQHGCATVEYRRMEQAALPTIFDIVGMAVFAISGAVAAARERQTFVTVGFFALITGVGGGSLRDVLIGAPVFWVGNAWAVRVPGGCAAGVVHA